RRSKDRSRNASRDTRSSHSDRDSRDAQPRPSSSTPPSEISLHSLAPRPEKKQNETSQPPASVPKKDSTGEPSRQGSDPRAPSQPSSSSRPPSPRSDGDSGGSATPIAPGEVIRF